MKGYGGLQCQLLPRQPGPFLLSADLWFNARAGVSVHVDALWSHPTTMLGRFYRQQTGLKTKVGGQQ